MSFLLDSLPVFSPLLPTETKSQQEVQGVFVYRILAESAPENPVLSKHLVRSALATNLPRRGPEERFNEPFFRSAS